MLVGNARSNLRNLHNPLICDMRLLLCAATPFEIAPVVEFIKEQNFPGIEVLITGVGMTAATYTLTKSVLGKRPDFILQAGVAGCLDEALPLTRIVLVEHETIGDLGVMQQGKFNSLFDLGLLNKNDPPWKDGKLSNNIESLSQTGLTIVNGVTVNEISTDRERIQFYREELGASIESMEGAALHYVALMENIRFLQIRSLSNFAGERDKSKWVMDMAIANLNLELQRMFTKILNR